MDDIISLCKFVSTQKIQQIDLFDGSKNLPYKSRLLYNGILAGKITNEESAIATVYKDNPAKNIKNFGKLKNRLRKRLLNSLLFLDSNKRGLTDRKKAELELSRAASIVNVLYIKSIFSSAIPLAKRTISKSIKYELPFYGLEISKRLNQYNAIKIKNKKGYQKSLEISKKLEVEYLFEAKATELYNEASLLYQASTGELDKETIERFKNYCDEFETLQSKTDYYRTNLLGYNTRSSFYLLIKEYDKAIALVNEALNFFSQKPFTDANVDYLLRTNLILSAIGTRDYNLALEYSDKNLAMFKKISIGWYIQRNYRFIAYTGLEDYQKMYSLTLEVVNSKNYKKFAIQHEYWKVIEAYVQFMIRHGVIDPSLDTSGLALKEFRLSKFLNEVPEFSKDKRGLNVSILVIQFMFLLIDQKYDAIIDRTDALKQYTYRYLKNDATFRSNLFLKLLIKVIEQDFHPVAVERHTHKLAARLAESQRDTDFQSNQLEIIPYEKMWEFVQEILERNR